MKIDNKRAFFDYEILEKMEAGINLYGSEVKAVRLGHADLSGSFVKIIGSEVYLVNAKIFPYKYATPEGYDQKRTRKLLFHKREIIALKSKSEGSNLALVPLSMYIKKGFIKVEVGLGKGKREYDKRAKIKKRDIQRSIEQELQN